MILFYNSLVKNTYFQNTTAFDMCFPFIFNLHDTSYDKQNRDFKENIFIQEYEYLLNNFIDTSFFSVEIFLTATIFVALSMTGCNWFLYGHGRYLTNLFPKGRAATFPIQDGGLLNLLLNSTNTLLTSD